METELETQVSFVLSELKDEAARALATCRDFDCLCFSNDILQAISRRLQRMVERMADERLKERVEA
jgi:hypothetical protein